MSSYSGLGLLSIFFAAACTVCLCDPARPSTDGLPVPKQHDLKVPYALEKLRPCSIRPSGYWHQTLQVICDGWVTRIAQSNDRTFYSLILDRDWNGLKIDAAALCVYSAGGIARLGRLFPDSWLGKDYRDNWLPRLLASQDSEGYIGAGHSDSCFQYDLVSGVNYATPVPKYELLNSDLTLETLIWEYEFSGSEAVLEAAKKLGDFVLERYLPPGPMPKDLNTPHTNAIFRALTDLYGYTGDGRVPERLEAFYRSRAGSFRTWLGNKRMHLHLPDICYTLQAPITMYHNTGDAEMRALALEGFDNLTAFAMQVSGAPTGSEITLEKGCRKYTEHCGVVEWTNVCTRFLRSTGEIRFADAAERCVYNAYFGSKSPDGLTLTYYHTVNQLYATTWTGEYLRDYEPSGQFRGYYSMAHSPGCCNAITSKGFPQFIENAALVDRDGGLCFVFFGPCEVSCAAPNGAKITVTQETRYPFEDRVLFRVTAGTPVEMPLRFRIPGWCRSAGVAVNGEPIQRPEPNTFATVSRIWSTGDVVELAFDLKVEAVWDRSPGAGPGVALVRGPLTYALPIAAARSYIGAGQPGPGNTGEAWNLIPADTSVWNVALVLDLDRLEDCVEFVNLDSGDNAGFWDQHPVGLRVRARRIPGWEPDRISGRPTTPALPAPPLRTEGETMTLTLLPFGCTQLRMTALPVIGIDSDKPAAHGEHTGDI